MQGHPVYYECSGMLDASRLQELGISADDFISAHVIVMENLIRNGLHIASARAGESWRTSPAIAFTSRAHARVLTEIRAPNP